MRTRVIKILITFFLIFTITVTLGCGKKGDPIPYRVTENEILKQVKVQNELFSLCR